MRLDATERRILELATNIKYSFEPVVMLSLYPRSQIDIFLTILHADGAVLSAAINAVTLALVHAGISLSSPLASVTLACIHKVPLLDPSGPEEVDLPSLTVACLGPPNAKATLVHLDSRLDLDRFEKMLQLGAEGCATVNRELTEVTRTWAKDLAIHLKRSSATMQLKP